MGAAETSCKGELVLEIRARIKTTRLAYPVEGNDQEDDHRPEGRAGGLYLSAHGKRPNRAHLAARLACRLASSRGANTALPLVAPGGHRCRLSSIINYLAHDLGRARKTGGCKLPASGWSPPFNIWKAESEVVGVYQQNDLSPPSRPPVGP